MPPFPLQWPDHLQRTAPASRVKSQFRTGLQAAMENVRTSLRLFGSETGKAVGDVVISSNAVLGDMIPADPGVAVWFIWDGEQRCIAVDRYDQVKDNLQAIHHVLEARRVELRHAGIVMVRATFRGFATALPAPDRRHWSIVLGVSKDADAAAVQASYKARAREYATRGDQASLSELNAARDRALKEARQ